MASLPIGGHDAAAHTKQPLAMVTVAVVPPPLGGPEAVKGVQTVKTGKRGRALRKASQELPRGEEQGRGEPRDRHAYLDSGQVSLGSRLRVTG